MKITMNSIITLWRGLAAAVLLIISAAQLNAAQLPVFTIINAGLGKQFGLRIHQIENQSALFKVSTPYGKVLLNQRIMGTEYSGIFSLEMLEEGEYVFTLETKANEIRQPVELTRRAILYQLSQRQVVHYPEVVQKGRQLDVNFDNPNRVPFTIKLLNRSDDVLYREEFTDLDEIEKRLNLLDLPRGVYHLQMTSLTIRWSKEVLLK